MKNARKLWQTEVVSSKVVRIDAAVFRVIQRIAIERGMESSTPSQVLSSILEEQGLLREAS